MPVQIPADLSRRVLLDCDEVLLQWSAGFQQWFEARFQERLHPNGPTEFNLAGWLPPAFQSRFFDLIVEFNESESYGALQPMDGAQDFLLLCRELDLEVYLVTAANSSSSTRAAVWTTSRIASAICWRAWSLSSLASPSVMCSPATPGRSGSMTCRQMSTQVSRPAITGS